MIHCCGKSFAEPKLLFQISLIHKEENGDAQCSSPPFCFFCRYPGEPVFSSQQWNVPRTTAPPRGRQGVSGATGEECVCVCVFAHPHLISFRSIVRWPFIVMVTKNLWSPLVSLDLVSETGSCLEGSGGHTAEPVQCLVCNPSAWDISRDFITKHARAPSNRLSMCLLTTLTAAINIRASAVREKIIYLYIIWWQPARSALRSLQ